MSNGNFIPFGESIKGRLVTAGLPTAAYLPANKHDSNVDRRIVPWFGTKPWGLLLCAAYPLIAIAPLIVLHILKSDTDHSVASQFGINCGLVGFTLLSMQFVLTARLPWIEAPFGLDLIVRFHRLMALVIVALLCAHPALIASDQGWRLITRFHAHWFIWMGRIALLLLAAQVTSALLRRVMRLPYERWKQIHNAVALGILVLGFVHSIWTGDELKNAGGLVLWAVVPAVALSTWLYTRAVRPHLLARRPFRGQAVKLEAPHVWTVTLSTPPGQPFHFFPGQFQFLRLLDSDVPAEEHPFSIASSSSRTDRICITIKACGDFTTLIERIRVGDRATVQGPFGRFSHDLHPDEKELVFVATGVGITPLMSMLRTMNDRREARQVTLIYASRGPDDILFTAELIALEAAQCPALKVICVLSQPPSWWTGETGHVDARRLRQWCEGLEDKAFYICCPPLMNTQLIRGLRNLGVSPRFIHCDVFSF
jgi:predicted ferric reductase